MLEKDAKKHTQTLNEVEAAKNSHEKLANDLGIKLNETSEIKVVLFAYFARSMIYSCYLATIRKPIKRVEDEGRIFATGIRHK